MAKGKTPHVKIPKTAWDEEELDLEARLEAAADAKHTPGEILLVRLALDVLREKRWAELSPEQKENFVQHAWDKLPERVRRERGQLVESPTLDAVVILGKDAHPSVEILELIKKKSVVLLGGNKKENIKEDEIIGAMRRRIGPQTVIYIMCHAGRVTEGILGGDAIGIDVLEGYDKSLKYFFKLLTEKCELKSPIVCHIYSCFPGLAVKNANELPIGSVVIGHGTEYGKEMFGIINIQMLAQMKHDFMASERLSAQESVRLRGAAEDAVKARPASASVSAELSVGEYISSSSPQYSADLPEAFPPFPTLLESVYGTGWTCLIQATVIGVCRSSAASGLLRTLTGSVRVDTLEIEEYTGELDKYNAEGVSEIVVPAVERVYSWITKESLAAVSSYLRVPTSFSREKYTTHLKAALDPQIEVIIDAVVRAGVLKKDLGLLLRILPKTDKTLFALTEAASINWIEGVAGLFDRANVDHVRAVSLSLRQHVSEQRVDMLKKYFDLGANPAYVIVHSVGTPTMFNLLLANMKQGCFEHLEYKGADALLAVLSASFPTSQAKGTALDKLLGLGASRTTLCSGTTPINEVMRDPTSTIDTCKMMCAGLSLEGLSVGADALVTVLSADAKNFSATKLELLLKCGANPCTPNSRGRVPLAIVANHSNLEVLYEILDQSITHIPNEISDEVLRSLLKNHALLRRALSKTTECGPKIYGSVVGALLDRFKFDLETEPYTRRAIARLIIDEKIGTKSKISDMLTEHLELDDISGIAVALKAEAVEGIYSRNREMIQEKIKDLQTKDYIEIVVEVSDCLTDLLKCECKGLFDPSYSTLELLKKIGLLDIQHETMPGLYQLIGGLLPKMDSYRQEHILLSVALACVFPNAENYTSRLAILPSNTIELLAKTIKSSFTEILERGDSGHETKQVVDMLSVIDDKEEKQRIIYKACTTALSTATSFWGLDDDDVYTLLSFKKPLDLSKLSDEQKHKAAINAVNKHDTVILSKLVTSGLKLVLDGNRELLNILVTFDLLKVVFGEDRTVNVGPDEGAGALVSSLYLELPERELLEIITLIMDKGGDPLVKFQGISGLSAVSRQLESYPSDPHPFLKAAYAMLVRVRDRPHDEHSGGIHIFARELLKNKNVRAFSMVLAANIDILGLIKSVYEDVEMAETFCAALETHQDKESMRALLTSDPTGSADGKRGLEDLTVGLIAANVMTHISHASLSPSSVNAIYSKIVNVCAEVMGVIPLDFAMQYCVCMRSFRSDANIALVESKVPEADKLTFKQLAAALFPDISIDEPADRHGDSPRRGSSPRRKWAEDAPKPRSHTPPSLPRGHGPTL